MDRRIYKITAREILDSRGNPTVEASVVLCDGSLGVASAPSGASTGSHEAHELRDGGSTYGGKGVLRAVQNVNGKIARRLSGFPADRQREIDTALKELDGSENKSVLGANAILPVSVACAKAAAFSYKMPLFRYLGGIAAETLPMPMMNILNGGRHASNMLDIQEFMIIPTSADTFAEALRICAEVYAELGKELARTGLETTVGDEGGYAPKLNSAEDALDLIVSAVEKSGYKARKDVNIALDIAAGEWYKNGGYEKPKSGEKMTRVQLLEYYMSLLSDYPIISIEDPFGEDDYIGFSELTKRAKNIQIVGDDIFVTNVNRIKKGVECGCANAVLIKPNQIGTLSETADAVDFAKANGYNTIISHRSGETEDTVIADIAVGLNAGQIKTGAPARGERTCKYNRLLRIEDILRKS